MIDGVVVKKLRTIPDERGCLMEVLRVDDSMFKQFGQVYVTSIYPGAVKAWHRHYSQIDYLTCVSGMIKLVLFDNRTGSPTHGELNEFFIGNGNHMLVKIPVMVYHGFKGIEPQAALVMNIVTEPYNYDQPDEHRIPWDSQDVPYDWGRKNG